MTKLESYMVGGSFTATQFYADIEGHPDDPNVKLALDELAYFTDRSKYWVYTLPVPARLGGRHLRNEFTPIYQHGI